jgi:predicted kinase
MTKLIVTRGPQASGKSTKAREWVAGNPVGRVRVNRDDLRAMANDYVYVGGKEGTEKIIRKLRDKLISTALLAVKDVVCDDTNLDAKTTRDLHTLAWLHGAEFAVWDLCHVPLGTCLARDAERIARGERGVGEAVIRATFQRARLPQEGGTAPAWTPEAPEAPIEPYVPDRSRSPYDYARVSTDAPNLAVIRVLQALRTGPFAPQVIFLSGRPDSCEHDTIEWLDDNVGLWDELWMRSAGDMRHDSVIKYELFTRHVAPRFNVLNVFDDRDRVVRLWRALGLPTFQVGDGDF